MASFGTLKVDPVDLVEKAERAFKCISACEDSLSRISASVRDGSSYWQGEAGDLVRAVYEKEAEGTINALQDLLSYPQDLLEYNGLYSDVIARTQGIADQLETFTMQ